MRETLNPLNGGGHGTLQDKHFHHNRRPVLGWELFTNSIINVGTNSGLPELTWTRPRWVTIHTITDNECPQGGALSTPPSAWSSPKMGHHLP